MKALRLFPSLALCALFACASPQVSAQVPQIIHYQGRITVGTAPFSGTGQFRFALVDGAGTTTFWSNDGTSTAGSQPSAALPLPVVNGLYVVPLGDATVGAMPGIPAGAFAQGDVRLRVWFDDGTNGVQLLAPDQRITSVGYAMMAGTVPDGAITPAKIAPGAVGTAQLAAGIAVPGALVWENVTGSPVQAVAGRGYVVSGGPEVKVTLPAAPAIGAVVRVVAGGGGLWRVAQNAGQQITGAALRNSPGSYLYNLKKVGDFLDNVQSMGASADLNRLAVRTSGGFQEGISVSWDGGVTFGSPNPGPFGAFFVASSYDGQKLLAGGFNLYRSTDGGMGWVQIPDFGNIGNVASSAGGTTLVVSTTVGANQVVYVSTDSGATWPVLRSFDVAVTGIASSADGTKLVVSTNPGQIWTSTDSGQTWTPRDAVRSWNSVASSADGRVLVASVTSGSVYTSVDAGGIWVPSGLSREWKSVAVSGDGARLLAIAQAGAEPGVLSANSVAPEVWTILDLGSAVPRAAALSVDGGSAVVFTDNGVYRSEGVPTHSSSTTAGVGGSLWGGPLSAAELVYVGGGQWVVASSKGTLLNY